MRDIYAKEGTELLLGKRGENRAVCVVFDVRDWRRHHGDGVVTLLHQRNGDKTPYPCAVEVDGNCVLWAITNTETERPGQGRVELQYWVGDTIAKSATYATRVSVAMGAAGEEPPEPAATWLEQMQQLGVSVELNAEEAEISAQAALASEKNAKGHMESAQAAGNVAVASMNAAAASEREAEAAAAGAKASETDAEKAAQTAQANAQVTATNAAKAEAERIQAEQAGDRAVSLLDQTQEQANTATQAKNEAVQYGNAAVSAAGEAQASKTAAAQSAEAARVSEVNARSHASTSQANAELTHNNMKRAEAAVGKTSYIGDNGNWYEWDADADGFVDTGVAARGDKGEKGDTGPAGPQGPQGPAGAGTGDMVSSMYDPQGKRTDVFAYVDNAVGNIPAPDVSGQIGSHNSDANAHSDIRALVTKAQQTADGKATMTQVNEAIAKIPTPDVSGQIATHNSSGTAHSDIRTLASNAKTVADNAAAKAGKLDIVDNNWGTDWSPSWYFENKPEQLAAERRSATELGVDTSGYCTALTLTHGNSASYGYPVQVAFVKDTMYIRRANGSSGWYPWETVANMSAVEEAIAAIPAPDVSGQISSHNSSTSAHSDIRALASNAIPKEAFVAAGTDLNTVTTSGIYRLEGAVVNGPANADWSQLLVMHGGGDTITQIIGSYSDGKLWHRSGNPTNTGGTGVWTAWAQVYDSNNKPEMYTYGTADLTAGTSALETGKLYFVYE